MPIAFTPATVNVYVTPFASPPTACVVKVPSTVVVGSATPSMYGVITYDVIGEPPSTKGSPHWTVASPSPGTAAVVTGPNGATLASVVIGCTGNGAGGIGT